MVNDRYSRQSFLGKNSQNIIQYSVIGVIGLGGGGSHIIQQLAHIGFLNFVIFDPDIVDESNLNRLVGAKFADINNKTPKIDIARRVIVELQPEANVFSFTKRWQENPDALKNCDVIFGCVDSFSERQEIEIFSRRFLMPYIDIGMGVLKIKNETPRMVGQIILSMPNGPCMHCLDFLNADRLSKEADEYGEAGPRPQVVWPNGILASSAVGMAINILTGWSESERIAIYLSYDGNSGTLIPHKKLEYLNFKQCAHFPSDKVGTPIFETI
jgi:molybdopterin-synthase adenylyltransferase